MLKLNRKIKTSNCWSLMCSRKCNIDIDMLNVIDILKFISLTPIQNQIWKDDNIIQLIKCLLNKINPIHTNYCLLPFISSSLGNNFSDKNIYNILDLFVKNPNFLILLSFEYNYLKNKIIKEPIENYLNLFIKDRIEADLKILIYKTTNLFSKIYTERTKFVDSDNLLPIIYPFDTTYVITKILEIVELQSSSKPILVKLLVKKVNSRSAEIEKRIILKSDKLQYPPILVLYKFIYVLCLWHFRYFCKFHRIHEGKICKYIYRHMYKCIYYTYIYVYIYIYSYIYVNTYTVYMYMNIFMYGVYIY